MRRKTALTEALAVLFWVAAWHIAATLANRSLLLKLPLPLDTLAAFARLCGEGRFWQGVGRSVLHILLGLAAGSFVSYRIVRALEQSFVQFERGICFPPGCTRRPSPCSSR